MVIFVVLSHIKINRTVHDIKQNPFQLDFLCFRFARECVLKALDKYQLFRHLAHPYRESSCACIFYNGHWIHFSKRDCLQFYHHNISIIGKVANIGNVLNILNPWKFMLQVSINQIKRNIGFCMPKMRITINGRNAQTYIPITFGIYRFKNFFFSKRVLYKKTKSKFIANLVN